MQHLCLFRACFFDIARNHGVCATPFLSILPAIGCTCPTRKRVVTPFAFSLLLGSLYSVHCLRPSHHFHPNYWTRPAAKRRRFYSTSSTQKFRTKASMWRVIGLMLVALFVGTNANVIIRKYHDIEYYQQYCMTYCVFFQQKTKFFLI